MSNTTAFFRIWFDSICKMPRGRGKSRVNNSRRCPIHNVSGEWCCVWKMSGERATTNVQTVNDDNPPISPDAPNNVEMIDTKRCDKCCRSSTDNYKLDFQSVQGDSTHHAMFGRHCVQERVQLCQHGVNYDNSTTRHKDWPNAWPNVLYTLLLETHRFSSNNEKLQTTSTGNKKFLPALYDNYSSINCVACKNTSVFRHYVWKRRVLVTY